MKEIVDFLKDKKIIFKKLEKIDIKLLKCRKKLEIYSGVDLNGYYGVIFKILQKSRFLMKNANEIEDLYKKLVNLKKHSYKKKLIFIGSPLCSKASDFLNKMGWKVYHVTL